MKKRLLSCVNYTIAAALSLFGLCDCSMQKNEYGCPATHYQEIETPERNEPSDNNTSDTLNPAIPEKEDEES